MKRLWTGNTVRQEAVLFAAVKRRFSPADAIEDACDDWERCPAGSIKHAIGQYVLGLSDAAFMRLVRDVEKARRL
jgi:hypothetical protein